MSVDERGCYADGTSGYYTRMLRADVEVEVEVGPISCQERYSNMDLRGTFETRDSRAL